MNDSNKNYPKAGENIMEKYEIPPRSTEFFHAFWGIHRNLMTFVQNTAAQNDLSMPQYITLMSISHHETMTQKRVFEKTHLPKSTLSHAIEGLVNEDILEREHVEGNRREMQLLLTTKGKQFVKQIYKQPDGAHQIFQKAFEALTEEQFSDLMHAHHVIATHLNQEGRDQNAQST